MGLTAITSTARTPGSKFGRRGGSKLRRRQHSSAVGEQLLDLQNQLRSGLWRPGRYVHFTIHEPKRRLISAAPFADRVVHHALCQLIEPRFEATFVPWSYANRAGKGTHRAVDRLHRLAQRRCWVLRLDIVRHFPSLDHAVLRELLWRRVPERGLRCLIDLILASGEDIHDVDASARLFPGDDLLALCRPHGLPIGNLTSQFWSNVYMDPLDKFVMRGLGITAYLRYVDDFALFADDRRLLLDAREQIIAFLARRLRLRVHEGSAQVQACTLGIPWLGFVVFPDHRRVKGRKVVQATRRLGERHAEWRSGAIRFAEFDASVQGWINHVRSADTWGLRQHVLGRLPLEGLPLR
jgi:RNA-directed DNA polymerase